MERIVLGYDGSPAAVSALNWTAARAARGLTKVDVVLVVSPFTKDRAPGLQHLGDAEAFLLERLPALEVELHRLEGAVTESIADAAEDADLVVIGINPGHPIRAAAAGWTPLRLSTRATAPVCMIPPGWTQGRRPRDGGDRERRLVGWGTGLRRRRGHQDLDRSSARAFLADAHTGLQRCDGRCRHSRRGDRGSSQDSRGRRSAGSRRAPDPFDSERTDSGQPVRGAAAIRRTILPHRHRKSPPGCADQQSARLGRAGDPVARGVPDLCRAAQRERARGRHGLADTAD